MYLMKSEEAILQGILSEHEREIQRMLESTTLVKTTNRRGYLPKKGFVLCHYDGIYGIGYTLHINNPDSYAYHIVKYFIIVKAPYHREYDELNMKHFECDIDSFNCTCCGRIVTKDESYSVQGKRLICAPCKYKYFKDTNGLFRYYDNFISKPE